MSEVGNPPITCKAPLPLNQAPLRPCHPRRQQGGNSYSTELCLTGSAQWPYISAQKKVVLKFLSVRTAKERGRAGRLADGGWKPLRIQSPPIVYRRLELRAEA